MVRNQLSVIVKKLTVSGLNGLPGFNVTDPKVNLSAPAGHPNMMGTAVIPNPTIVTVELVSLHMYGL